MGCSLPTLEKQQPNAPNGSSQHGTQDLTADLPDSSPRHFADDRSSRRARGRCHQQQQQPWVSDQPQQRPETCPDGAPDRDSNGDRPRVPLEELPKTLRYPIPAAPPTSIQKAIMSKGATGAGIEGVD